MWYSQSQLMPISRLNEEIVASCLGRRFICFNGPLCFSFTFILTFWDLYFEKSEIRVLVSLALCLREPFSGDMMSRLLDGDRR